MVILPTLTAQLTNSAFPVSSSFASIQSHEWFAYFQLELFYKRDIKHYGAFNLSFYFLFFPVHTLHTQGSDINQRLLVRENLV